MSTLVRKGEMGYLCVAGGGGLRMLEAGAGMLDGMRQMGIGIDKGVGSSAGGAILAFHFNNVDMLQLYKGTPREKAMRQNSYWRILMGDPVYDNSGFAALLNRTIPEQPTKEVVVTMTDALSEETIFTQATNHTVLCSTSMPEVFPAQLYTGLYWDWKGKCKHAEKLKVVDGGVYDNIPVPNMKTASSYDHIFILVCNEDTMSEAEHQTTRIGRSLGWVNETMEREYRQLVNDWEWLPNVTIIRPPPFRSSLLDWSEKWGLYAHAKEYTTQVLSKLMQEGTGPYRQQP